ncbi:hypothetical protein [Streptomyces flavidovirens]
MNQAVDESAQPDVLNSRVWVVACSSRDANTAVFAWTCSGIDDAIHKTRQAAERAATELNENPKPWRGAERVYAFTYDIRPAEEEVA